MAVITPFKVKCESCELTLTVNDLGLVGKKIYCKRCKYPILIKAPEDDGSETAPAKKADSTGPKTTKAKKTDAAKPSANGAAKTEKSDETEETEEGGKKKKKKKAGGSNSTLLIGGGIGILAVGLIVGGYFAFFAGDEKPNDQAKQDGDSKGGSGMPEMKNPGVGGPKNPGKGQNPGMPNMNNAGNPQNPNDPNAVGNAAPNAEAFAQMTNFLPGESQWVLSIGKDAKETPVFGVLFDSAGSGKAFKTTMGFSGDDIDHFLMSGSGDMSWVFGAIKLKKELTIANLKTPLKLVAQKKILNRDWYTLGSNDLLKMIREYTLSELKSLGWPARAVDPSQTLSLVLLDSRTLVFAETNAMKKFLAADIKRDEKTKYNPPNAGFGPAGMGQPRQGMGNMGMPQPGMGINGQKPPGLGIMGNPQPQPGVGIMGNPQPQPGVGIMGNPQPQPGVGIMGNPQPQPGVGIMGNPQPQPGIRKMGQPQPGLGIMGNPQPQPGLGIMGNPQPQPGLGIMGNPQPQPGLGIMGNPQPQPGLGIMGNPQPQPGQPLPLPGLGNNGQAQPGLGNNGPPMVGPGHNGPRAGGQETGGFTTNPTFLTVDPDIKIMLNQLEQDKSIVATFVVKIDDTAIFGGGPLDAMRKQAPNIGAIQLPKSPVIGLCVQTMNPSRFTLVAAIQMDTSEQAKTWSDALQLLLPIVADALTETFDVKITTGRSGMGGMNPGGMNPNPGGFPNPGGMNPNPGGFPNPGGMNPNPGGFPNPNPGGLNPNPGGFPNPNNPNPGNRGVPGGPMGPGRPNLPGGPMGPGGGRPMRNSSGLDESDDQPILRLQQPPQPPKLGNSGQRPGGFNGQPGGGQPGGFNGQPPRPGGFNGQPGGIMGQPGGFNGQPPRPGGFNGQPGGMNGQPGGFNGQPGGMNGQPGGMMGMPRPGGMMGMPQPGGLNQPGIGQPLNPNNPGGQSGSTISVTSQDRLLMVKLDLDWSATYNDISPNLRVEMDRLKGKAQMLTGRAHWANSAVAIKKFEQSVPHLIPQGAYPRKSNPARFNLPYPPDQRVSWMVEMLPYLGYDTVYAGVKKELAWNDESNLHAGSVWITEFLSPKFPESTWTAKVPSLRGRTLGATHFVGLSGIGMDSPEYPDTPEYAKKLGVFGYDRRTAFKDITDGMSNTIFMIQTPPNVPRPWIRGGGSTVQGVPLKGSITPFVSEQPDARFGTFALMTDGSVRFIGADISDEVFQSLVTYKGGEKIGDIQKIAPLENALESELKSTAPMQASFPPAGIEWAEIEVPEIGGSIRMPSTPERRGKKTAVDISYVWPRNSEGDPLLTMTIFTPVIKLKSGVGTDAELDALLGEIKNKGIKIESVTSVKIAGTRLARRYEVVTGGDVMLHQVFISANRGVIMEVAKNGKAKPEDIKKYFDSVTIGPAPSSSPPKKEELKVEPKAIPKADVPKVEPKAAPKTDVPKIEPKAEPKTNSPKDGNS